MSKTNEIATREEQVKLSNPRDIMNFATNLKDLIVQNKLFTSIRGKNYVNVEGWQIAGAFTGTFPIVEKVEQLESKPGEYKYRAEVSLRNNEDKVVGYGMAICSNRESGKAGFDEYAVASMAQTRAVGKAFRMKIGWLLKVAGYETTPAEEMDAIANAEIVPPRQPNTNTRETAPQKKEAASNREISIAIDRLQICSNIDDLKAVWADLDEAVRQNPEVRGCKDSMKAKLTEVQNGVEE